MDKLKAKELEKSLKGSTLNGYEIIELINNGKSGAVFKTTKFDYLFALKIFDNELIEKFGHEIQTIRIKQEIALKNHTISGLVKIHEGGYATLNGQTYLYIVMEFIDGINLKDYIQKMNYEQEFILKVLQKLLSITEQLLEKKIVHRDIKPENIMINSNGDIILMDLGVLKFIGAKSFSDEEESSFVATLRYAAPELLFRIEEDTIDGWRAVNLYQIGATLHDLIMKKELFYDKTPYSNLVVAIKDDIPNISNSEYSFELLQLTRNLMTKDWRIRLELNTRNQLDMDISAITACDNPLEKDTDVIRKITLKCQAKLDTIETFRRTKEEIQTNKQKVALELLKTVDNSFKRLQSMHIYKKINKSNNFKFDALTGKFSIQNYLYELKGDLQMGFPCSLFILVSISNDESNYTEIDLWGIFPIHREDINNPNAFFQTYQPMNKNNHIATKPKITIKIFQGIVHFDELFDTHLTNQILKFITKALQMAEDRVKYELEWQEKSAKATNTVYSMTSNKCNIIINSL